MMVGADEAMTCAYKVLTALQDDANRSAIAGIAVAFFAYTKKFGLDPYSTYELGRKIASPQDFHYKANCQREALDDFLGLSKSGRLSSVPTSI